MERGDFFGGSPATQAAGIHLATSQDAMRTLLSSFFYLFSSSRPPSPICFTGRVFNGLKAYGLRWASHFFFRF